MTVSSEKWQQLLNGTQINRHNAKPNQLVPTMNGYD